MRARTCVVTFVHTTLQQSPQPQAVSITDTHAAHSTGEIPAKWRPQINKWHSHLEEQLTAFINKNEGKATPDSIFEEYNARVTEALSNLNEHIQNHSF